MPTQPFSSSQSAPLPPYMSSSKPKSLWPNKNYEHPSIDINTFNGDLRAWNKAWEEELTFTYQHNTPPLITDSAEDRLRFDEQLEDRRLHTRKDVAEHVFLMECALTQQARVPAFERTVQRWKEVGRARREEIVLQTLQDSDQRSKRSVRILLPELTLDNLAGGDGGGLIKLVDRLLAPDDLKPPNYTILRHAELERLYGFPPDQGGGSMVLSKAVRALQSEMLLIRHSHLLVIINAIFELLDGQPLRKRVTFGDANERFDIDQTARLTSRDIRGKKINLAPPSTSGPRCSEMLCNRTSTPAGRVLNLCGSCQAIGRCVPYCSRECQKRDYKVRHKAVCGKPLEDVQGVPLFTSFHLESSTGFNRFLIRQLGILQHHPETFWVIFDDDKNQTIHRTFQKNQETKEGVVEEISKGEAEVRYLATKRRDRVAIGTIALILVDCIGLDLKPYARSEERAEEDKRELERQKNLSRRQLEREFEMSAAELEGAMQVAVVEMPHWAKELHSATVAAIQAQAREQDALDRRAPFEAYQLFKEDDSATETETNMLKLFTSMAMSPELDDPTVDEETKDRIFDQCFRASGLMPMGDAKMEEQD